MPQILGMREFMELPQGLYGGARANALSTVDQRYCNKTLIIADLSNDLTYAEILFERFGRRVIGVQIGRYGDGMTLDPLQINNNTIYRYKVGRTFLFDLLLREMQDDKVRLVHGEESVRAYEQLMALEVEIKQTGIQYNCLSGRNDDLAISCALLNWASLPPHLEAWSRALEPPRRRVFSAPSPSGWT